MKPTVLILCAAALLSGCGSACENEISQSVTSPSGAMKAVVFNRACGATVGVNTQVSIVPSNRRLSNDPGNVLIVDNSIPLEIHWDSDSSLRIAGMKQEKIFRQETSLDGVRVEYSR